jgi:trk system potassium uptake protein TrkH
MISLRRILWAVAAALRIFSLVFLVPLPFAFVYEDWTIPLVGALSVPRTIVPFLEAFLAATLAWGVLRLVSRSAQDEELTDREGTLAVGIGWLAATLLAMVPFLASRSVGGPGDAFFEAMSGLTGTASTAMSGYAGLPASLVAYRALLSWTGGLAIIVLMVALLSRLTHAGLPSVQGAGAAGTGRLKPKLAVAARSLGLLYFIVTVVVAAVLAGTLFLRIHLDAKAAVFQGLVQGMGAYAAGGIADPAGPWPGAGDPVVDGVLVVAMLLGGTNFALTFSAVRRGGLRRAAGDAEWRLYLGVFAGLALLVDLLLVRAGRGVAFALHHGTYTAASLLTGTGTYTVDYAAWPAAVLLVLLLGVLAGASTGSPAGGIKSLRFVVLGRLVLREWRKILHPRAVVPVRVGSTVLKEEAVAGVMAFFFTYLALWTLGAVALLAIAPSLDATDSAAAAASALGDVGAGFGHLGPAHGLGALPAAGKLVLCALMWLGRLEVFTALVLFNPLSWRT